MDTPIKFNGKTYTPSGSEEPRPMLNAIHSRRYKAERVFVPASERIGSTNLRSSIDHWYWNRRTGLRVVYRRGLGDMRSGYKTLEQFYAGENVVEVSP